MRGTFRQPTITVRERLSIPGPGRSVSAAAEQRAVYIRKAVHVLETYFIDHETTRSCFLNLFSPQWQGPFLEVNGEPFQKRAAWALVNVWLLGRSAGSIGPEEGMTEAEDWFVGTRRRSLPSLARKVPADVARNASTFLANVPFDEDFLDLLPYLLDEHGPGTRLSVLKNPATRPSRMAKRLNGVFYTPADVAEYMAECVLYKHSRSLSSFRCLDPACGTGVFLVALMRKYFESIPEENVDRFSFAMQSLYGFDISALAVETCVFVLLHHCLSEALSRRITPWSAWQLLRLNVAAVDAITVTPGGLERECSCDELAIERAAARTTLLDATSSVLPLSPKRFRKVASIPEMRYWAMSCEVVTPLDCIFPEAAKGFEVLVGNPPYASLGKRPDHGHLGEEYVSMRNSQRCTTENTYPLFIEMMWRLTKSTNNVSALVVPLSISYHQGRQYSECRRAMAYQGGCWSFSFFDREPHGLFGEDVKTRNAILIHRETVQDPPRGALAKIETGHLRKWTSRTRDRLFSSISFTSLEEFNLKRGIPKLSGMAQAEAFTRLLRRHDSFRTLWSYSRNCLPEEASKKQTRPRVFVASTAYNFLNVFRSIEIDSSATLPLSSNGVLCLEFSSEEMADVAFSILSSRLTFWLWHTLCDGFHVPRWFIESVPFGQNSFSKEQEEVLQATGQQLWRGLQRYRIVSINGGKQTIAYKPLCLEEERNIVDSVLIDAAGLQESFGKVLQEIVRNNVVVDEMDKRRTHLSSHFQFAESIT